MSDEDVQLRDIIRAKCDETADAPCERTGEGWAGILGGFCPVQGHGEVGDQFWYFRARHDAWSFEVYPTTCEGDLPPADTLVWDLYGSHDNASWMPYSEAWRRIEGCLAAFRRWEARESRGGA